MVARRAGKCPVRILLVGILLFILALPFAAAVEAAAPEWRQQASLSLPLKGALYVTQGWGGAVTHSGRLEYAVDFVVVGARSRSYRGRGQRLSDYYTWQASVYAPAGGVVVALENSVRDNEINRPNATLPWGNYVIIDHGQGEFSLLAHFKQDSLRVKVGDKVTSGQLLGLAGNSGFSYAPHIHYQLQDGPSLGAQTLPATFARYYEASARSLVLRTNQVPREGDVIYKG